MSTVPSAAAATGNRTQEVDAGLRVRELRKSYGETIALDGLNLDAGSGGILGIAGPNGAGKSTRIKTPAAETPADTGEIVLDGIDWNPGEHRDRVAVVHQEPHLFPNLSVADNMLVGREGTRARRPKIGTGERDLILAGGGAGLRRERTIQPRRRPRSGAGHNGGPRAGAGEPRDERRARARRY